MAKALLATTLFAWCLVLGDNIFHGQHFSDQLKRAASRDKGTTVFGYIVKDPERFGVVELDASGKAKLCKKHNMVSTCCGCCLGESNGEGKGN